MSDVQRFIEESIRNEVRRLLRSFPDSQVDTFARVFPGGIDRMSEEKLRDALALCFRTASKNEGKDFRITRFPKVSRDDVGGAPK